MENPLELPVPDDFLERIQAFTRDLAYGVVMEFWDGTTLGEIGVGQNQRMLPLVSPLQHRDKHDALQKKWVSDFPALRLLETFGYLNGSALTPAAFHLLQRPILPPEVFISYKRGYSSTFGLLIEARLQAKGISAFIDRSLDAGEPWDEQLEEKIQHSNFVICLLAKETLKSAAVIQEMRWARKYERKVIPIWHSGFNEDLVPPEFQPNLGKAHAIQVLSESAEAYHDAVEKLINRLGYSTLTSKA